MPLSLHPMAQRIADFRHRYGTRPPSGMDSAQFRHYIDTRRAETAALVEALIPHAEGLLLPVNIAGGAWGITREMRPDGSPWRVTRFDADMTPMGHHSEDRVEAAIEEVLRWADATRLHEAQFGAPTPAITDTPEFKRWFGDSKIVDANGHPLIVYHGVKDARFYIEHGRVIVTPPFDVFDTKGKIEPGVWFSPDPKVAAHYGTPVACYLRAANPMREESPLSAVPAQCDAVYRMRGQGDAIAGAWEIAVFDASQIMLANADRHAFAAATPDILSRTATMPAFSASAIEQHRTPAFKGRAKLIEMPIADFLALTPAFVVDADKLAKATVLLRDGIPFTDIPFLKIDAEYRVFGHEGRHRALALMAQGVTTMPVVLNADTIRWDQQNDPGGRFDYIASWPSALRADGRAENPDLTIPFPVTREASALAYVAQDDDDAHEAPSPRRSRGMGW